MDLSMLSRNELVDGTKRLVAQERRISTEVLWHLLEIERRRLFAELGYLSLYEYCVKVLSYSEGAAYRRISAMRLLRDVPEVEKKLVSGALTVTAAAKLQGALTTAKRHEKKIFTTEQKTALIEKVEGRTSVECDRLLATEVCKTVARREDVRPVDAELTRVSVVVDAETFKMLERIKELSAAKLHGKSDYGSLLKLMAKIVLDEIDPEKQHKPNEKMEQAARPARYSSPVYATKGVALPSLAKVTRYIPVHVKRDVWRRDKGECGYIDHKTGKKCGARWGLEYDHCQPFALDGAPTVENLRLRCRAHNMLYAQQMGLARPVAGRF